MKRPICSSDDSLGVLMSICPTTDEKSPRNNLVYSREFQTMLDGLDEDVCLEEANRGHGSEKKRRLSVDQVKALEKYFEVENKLEPDRKVKLAQELGLQPRQVAVWFQNRRARWKTKQLERDYGVLKANYDALKLNYDTLQRDNEALHKEIRELKSKLMKEENTESNQSVVKEEEIIIVHEEADRKKTTLDDDQESNKPAATPLPHPYPVVTTISLAAAGSQEEPDQELTYNNSGVVVGISLFPDFKDGSSDSDSSAILNEDNNNNNSPNNANGAISSSGVIQNQQHHQLSMNCFEFSKPAYHSQFVKMEEHNFFGEETCNFFSDEQAPTLPWYCPDQWT